MDCLNTFKNSVKYMFDLWQAYFRFSEDESRKGGSSLVQHDPCSVKSNKKRKEKMVCVGVELDFL